MSAGKSDMRELIMWQRVCECWGCITGEQLCEIGLMALETVTGVTTVLVVAEQTVIYCYANIAY